MGQHVAHPAERHNVRKPHMKAKNPCPKLYLHLRLTYQNSVRISHFPVRIKCAVHLLLDSINQIVSGEENKL
jgi:hypothetical protein